MSQASSLPTGVPRRLARRPQIAAAWLRWRNAYRLRRARLACTAALAVALVIGLLAASPTGAVLEWLAGSPAITFAISACLFGLSAVRRLARIQGETATSWLAALPVRSSALLRLISGTLSGVLATVCFIGLARVAGQLTWATASLLALLTAAGALAGTLAGWRLQGGAAAGSPGWQYATARRARLRWATAPSLAPLSCWPVAQARIFSRPKQTSLLVLIALLSIPSGAREVPGQVAIAVAAGAITLFTLLSLSLAPLRAASDAARWLAPTKIRLWAFILAFVWRVAAKQAAVLGVVVSLACAVDYPQALRVGITAAVAYLVVSCAAAWVVCLWACRRVGLGMMSRDP